MSLWWSAAGARGLARGWSRFYTCLAGTAPCGVRFPSHGIGLVSARRRTRCPRNDHRRAEIDAARSPPARGSQRRFSSSCMPGVNLSPDSNNIFSQPQKTPHDAQTKRAGARGRARTSHLEGGTPPRRPRVARSAVGRATLACTLAGRASFLVPSLPPVPGGAAARVGDGVPPPDAPPGPASKRPRNAE